MALVCAGMSAANADTGNGRNQPIIGQFTTTDTNADTMWLGHDTTGCTAKIKFVFWLGFNFTATYHYSIPGLTNYANCPDMGVAVSRGAFQTDDVILTWFSAPPPLSDGTYAPPAYVVHNLAEFVPAAGEDFPSFIGSGYDFNGDGQQDYWERSDEGEGFRTFVRSGNTYVAGAATFSDDSVSHEPLFAQLDGQPGTDVVSAYAHVPDQLGVAGSGPVGVVVAFGKSGAKTVLVSSSDFHTKYVPSIVDHNSDGKQDVMVVTNPGDPASTVTYYLNDGNGNFTPAP